MEQAFSNLFVSGKAKQAGKLKQQSKSKSSMKVDTSNYSVNLTAKEQKERLWQYLMEHNNNNNDSIISDDRSSSSSNSNNNKTSNNNINACPVERIWPTYDSVVAHVTMQDYQQNLVCPHDHHVDSTKLICPHGSVCCAKMELFPFPTPTSSSQKPYTGLLTPNTTVEHCLVRLSSAIRPLDQQQQQQGNQSDFTRIMVRNAVGEKLANAKIVPGAAIKCFRGDNIPSGNLLFLGSKVGQREEDYFAHCLSTTMTEKMPAIALPFVRKFSKYSNYPLSLGVSDFCAFDQDGKDCRGGGEQNQKQQQQHNFPYIVTLQPVLTRPATTTTRTNTSTTTTENNSKNSNNKHRKQFTTFDSFIDEVTTIPIGTTLFDIYAVPDPDSVGNPAQLQRIGRIVTTTNMISSAPTDGIFFRHQIKEEDFELRPQWKAGLNRKMTMDGGKTKGTVGKLAGWRLFEENIAKGKYIDYEEKASS